MKLQRTIAGDSATLSARHHEREKMLSASDTQQNIEAKAEIAEWMLSLLRKWKPTGDLIGCEVGVKQGNLACKLLSLDSNLTLYGFDRWAAMLGSTYAALGDPAALASNELHEAWYTEAQERLRQFGSRSRLHKMESVDGARNVADRTLDFVYLDADHSYAGRAADLVAWTPTVRGFGYVMGGLWSSAFGGNQGERAARDFLDSVRWSCPVLFGPHKTWAIRKPER